ncbi:hypothetical protein ACXHXM_34175
MALITVESLPTNTLEAVNLALAYMREPPIDDLALVNTSFPVEQAYRAVIQMTRTVQRRDYAFNQYKAKLTAELDAESGEYRIAVDPRATKVALDPTAPAWIGVEENRPMLRGKLNAETKQHDQFVVPVNTGLLSYDWGKAVTLDVVITITLAFDELPEAAKAVVSLEAAALVGERAGEGIENSPFHTLALQEAQSDLMNYDLTVSPCNFYSTLDNRR